MTFCTAISCMDGRIQLPVIRYLKKRFNTEYVDMITEAGPNRILAEQDEQRTIESIVFRMNISVNNHQSRGIAVIGHHDCAGNPTDKDTQLAQIRKSIHFLKEKVDGMVLIGLWVDENWQVSEVQTAGYQTED